jgi:hypothetical protein
LQTRMLRITARPEIALSTSQVRCGVTTPQDRHNPSMPGRRPS